MNNTRNPIKIFIVDDHPLVRNGLASLISDEKDIIVCGEADNVNDAILLIGDKKPDVAIVDILIDKTASGIELIKGIRERYPEVAVLVLSMYEDSNYVERAIRAGAKGYIQKSDSSKSIIDAIYKIIDGKMVFSEDVTSKIVDKFIIGSRKKDESYIGVLSNKEFDVFQLFGIGLDTIEIASRLNVSKHTVDSHRRNIKRKLNLRNNNELIMKAVDWVRIHR